MKIVILVDYCDSSPPVSLENCKNRFQLYAYMLYKHIKDSYAEITFNHIGSPCVNNADHTIIIGDNSHRPDFGKVMTLGISNVSHQGEDMMFYMDNCCNDRTNTIYIGWLNDPTELYPDKDDTLHVLIQNPYKECKLYDKIVNTMTKVKNKHKITVGILSNNYYRNLNTNSITVLDNYKVRYEIIRKSHVYILTSNMFDRELLYNFAMCNTLIVTNDTFISPKILNDVDCLFYDDDISWKDIVSRVKHINSRERIIKLKTAEHAITKMVGFMEPFDDSERSSESNDVIIHKIKKDRRPTLLQSELRSMR